MGMDFVVGDCEEHPQIKLWSEWTQQTDQAKIAAGGHWKLVEDVVLTDCIDPTAELCIDLGGYTLTAADGEQAFHLSKVALSVMDSGNGGTIRGSATAVENVNGGVVNVNIGATLNLYKGTITGGKITRTDTKNANGGNIYVYGGTFNMYGGAVTDGQLLEGAAELRGGNICVASYETYIGTAYITGGSITGGVAGHGGNIYVTSELEISGPVLIGGGNATTSADNIYNKGITTISGATFTAGETDRADFYGSGMSIGNGVTFADKAPVLYLTCSALAYNGSTYKTFAQMADAQQHAGANGTVTLYSATTVDSNLKVTVRQLNLNGQTLTVAGVFNAENADVVDTVGDGYITAEGVMFKKDNANLPVTVAGNTYLEANPTATVVASVDNTLESDMKKFGFYFNAEDEKTRMDEALLEENNDLDILVLVTVDGETETYALSKVAGGAISRYAADWDNGAILMKISGVAGRAVSIDLIVASNGYETATRKPSSVSEYNSDFDPKIKEKYTWNDVNILPIKREDMTVEEMRQLVVDFYQYSAGGYVWAASDDLTYAYTKDGKTQSITQGQNYAGLPYVAVGTGNIYRLMDYIDPDTGVVNMDWVSSNPRLFGNQCSISCQWAWARVINSVKSGWTDGITAKNGYIFLGNLSFKSSDQAEDIINNNSRDALYEAYAQLQPGDGLVKDGHVIMCTSEPMERNHWLWGRQQYVYIAEQTQSSGGRYWVSGSNESGDSYKTTGGTQIQMTFSELYSSGYVPFTFAEFHPNNTTYREKYPEAYEKAAVEETSVRFSHTGATITKEELFGSSVISNYFISDIYAIVTDSQGNEVYRYAQRNTAAATLMLEFNESATTSDGATAHTTWGRWKDLSAKETYTVQIVAQLGTGERPVLWTGKLAQ